MFSKLFVDCLLWLAIRGYAPDDLIATDPALTQGIDLTSDSELQRVLQAEEGESSGFVRLPRIGARVPLLHLKHGEEHGIDMLRITVAIVGKNDDGEPVATAWRFESPEGRGEHDYWHCQPVREMRYGRQIPPLDALPDWYFHDTPTFPLQAKDPEQLLVCVLVSIYGLAEFRKMQRDYFSDQLADHLAALLP